jgi:hypothetical protein
MMRRVYILVPGIRTRTDDNQAWAVAWSDRIMQRYRRTAPAASEFRYFVGALSRRLSQQRYARQLAAMIEGWYDAGFAIVAVCHSNGADLLSRALRLTGAHLEAAHLIAAACDADIAETGFLDAVENGRLGRVVSYISRSDSALGTWARLSRHWAFLGLGYGTLGYDGPQGVPTELRSRFPVVSRDYLEHGDWFDSRNIDSTFAAVTVHEREHSPALP